MNLNEPMLITALPHCVSQQEGQPKFLSLLTVLCVIHNGNQWGTEDYPLLAPKQGQAPHLTGIAHLLQCSGHMLSGWC
jgi:hypothetical protein